MLIFIKSACITATARVKIISVIMQLLFRALAICFFLGMTAFSAPTYGDLAVLLARGYFKDAVSPNASVEECVAFLNGNGVQFSIFDLMDPDIRVTKEKFARAVGQSQLLLSGEATVENGVIIRPNNIASWFDYCLLNDINLSEMWTSFVRRVEKNSVPEVERFFENR